MGNCPMSAKDLRDYLEIVVAMEREIYHQECTIQRLYEKIDLLPKPRKLEPPERPPAPSSQNTPWWSDVLHKLILSAVFFGGGWLLGFAVMFVIQIILLWIYEIPDSFLWKFCSAVGIIGALIVWMPFRRADSSAMSEYELLCGKYERDFEKYKQEQIAEDARAAKVRIEKEVLNAYLQLMIEQNKNSSTTMEHIYSLNIVHPNYRNLAAVCTLFEYVDTGRCFSLEAQPGSEGGYNLLESERRANRIIVSLDRISTQLEEIKANQYQMYCAISEANNKADRIFSACQRMASELEAIEKQNEQLQLQREQQLDQLIKNSELWLSCAQQTQRELNYMNKMNYYAGVYDSAGSALKRPPM